ncbi:maleate cis-trans isomerase family protein [Nisaea sp.]|uniref:maleate cis-trans isomerase family protein n=1 Tax=Nisaea sp. TaxID=2024842 RepID=UPI003B524D61
MAKMLKIDPDLPWRHRLGLIVLKTDETIEQDFRHVAADPAIALYHTRIESAPNVTPETLRQMEARIPGAAVLLPQDTPLDVIGYGCTSASTVMGEDRVAELVRSIHSTAAVTNPLSALKAAARALGVKRLGLVSPYVRSVTDALEAEMAKSGMPFVESTVFGQEEERVVARISLGSITRAAEAVAGNPGVGAVFASCTNLRAASVIHEAERSTNKPFLCSNQVLAWHMMRLAGITRPIPELGRLGSLQMVGQGSTGREIVA